MTTEVAQVAYGHETRKRTWLYAVGCDLPALDWSEPLATKQVSGLGANRKHRRYTRAQSLVEGQSNYTPAAFRDVLLEMARSAAQVAA